MRDSYNPYAPPTNDEVVPPSSEAFTYKSSEGLAAALRVMLGVSTAVLLINVGVMSMQIELLGRATRGTITMSEAQANDQRVLLATAVSLLAWCVTGIIWCVWQSRTSKNVRALGAKGLRCVRDPARDDAAKARASSRRPSAPRSDERALVGRALGRVDAHLCVALP